MNIGDRVTTPNGAGVITRFHYEPVSLGTRNVRRIAWVLIRYDNGTTQFVPPNTITQEEPVTTIEPTTEPVTEPVGEPDPTPPPTEPADDDDDAEDAE